MGPYLLVLHDDRAWISSIKTENVFRNFHKTNNTVSDYFHFSEDWIYSTIFLFMKSGKALASLVAPYPTPLYCS